MRTGRRSSRGMTLIELMVSLTIFSVLAYALLSSLDLSNSSRRTVASIADQNASLRDALCAIADDMRICSDDHVVLNDQADGSTRVTMQLPIVVGGEVQWGVPAAYAQRVGGADQQDWSMTYEIVAGADGETRLVRRILDDGGDEVRRETITDGLAAGGADPPGLLVAQTGDVWEVTVALGGARGRMETIHVGTRN